MGKHKLSGGEDIEDFVNYLFCPNCKWSENPDDEYSYYDDDKFFYRGDKIDPIPI